MFLRQFESERQKENEAGGVFQACEVSLTASVMTFVWKELRQAGI